LDISFPIMIKPVSNKLVNLKLRNKLFSLVSFGNAYVELNNIDYIPDSIIRIVNCINGISTVYGKTLDIPLATIIITPFPY